MDASLHFQACSSVAVISGYRLFNKKIKAGHHAIYTINTAARIRACDAMTFQPHFEAWAKVSVCSGTLPSVINVHSHDQKKTLSGSMFRVSFIEAHYGTKKGGTLQSLGTLHLQSVIDFWQEYQQKHSLRKNEVTIKQSDLKLVAYISPLWRLAVPHGFAIRVGD
ncbi:hypothetical protein CEXT_343831 [Caerostris extrusa]|uniref:LAGLIDADG homing endonuclease n=1 Tax=Caerostris extrusa TaxID=172846 RepID=A0AAV4UUM0_CAEEX|nr:hypothetical protein CEXT_343831 [Caerostris extrusa]